MDINTNIEYNLKTKDINILPSSELEKVKKAIIPSYFSGISEAMSAGRVEKSGGTVAGRPKASG